MDLEQFVFTLKHIVTLCLSYPGQAGVSRSHKLKPSSVALDYPHEAGNDSAEGEVGKRSKTAVRMGRRFLFVRGAWIAPLSTLSSSGPLTPALSHEGEREVTAPNSSPQEAAPKLRLARGGGESGAEF